MKRSNVQYRPLNSQDKVDRASASSNSDSDSDDVRATSSVNDDFVDFQQTALDKHDGVRFQPNNGKRKKKFQQWIPEQFSLPKHKVPWRSISYAVVLFLMGTALLLCGCLIHVGKVDNEKYGDRLWPLIIFGLLMFIPGSYHVYLVVNVFLGKPGYTFEDFPQFED